MLVPNCLRDISHYVCVHKDALSLANRKAGIGWVWGQALSFYLIWPVMYFAL